MIITKEINHCGKTIWVVVTDREDGMFDLTTIKEGKSSTCTYCDMKAIDRTIEEIEHYGVLF